VAIIRPRAISACGTTAEATPPAEATAPPDDDFLASLVTAMRGVAAEERVRSVAELRTAVDDRITQLEARARDRGEELRRKADLDMSGIADWEKAEVERVNAEAARKVEARRQQLEQQVADHETRSTAEVEGVRGRVTGYEQELEAFFAQLEAIADPAAFVAAARRMPKPPGLDTDAATPVSPPDATPAASLNARPAQLGIGSLDGLAAERLGRSIDGLRLQAPEMSAFRTLSKRQARVMLGSGVLFVLGMLLAPVATLVSLNGLITAMYLGVFVYNIRIFRRLLRTPPVLTVTADDARSIADDALPTYTVLVAAYHESEIITRTIRSLEALDYPTDRLEILLLLEADDTETITRARAARPLSHIRIVEVPEAAPKTKPKACNYGLQLSSGELVTIFDAEDRPDPLQLRRAAVAFTRVDADVACLQAKLYYHNVGQNRLTKFFAAEYVTWFSSVLPTLVDLGDPIPLGGTSFHIRRDVLEAAGAWDPFNVTEDADLGVRLTRLGHRTLVLDSITFEEANSDFINWVKQRSRWYKGYLQTWLVHMRDPRLLWRQLGPGPFLGFQVTIGATPLLALLNPFFWLLTVLWFLTHSAFVQTLFPAWIYYPALISIVFGNFLAVYRTMIAVRLANYPELVVSALLTPLYWVLMSIAAFRAFAQLIVAPSFWEKTVHGLDRELGASTPPTAQATGDGRR